MKNVIQQLNKIAANSNDRAAKNIKNLIGRIEYFNNINDDAKLNECLAESELWIGA